MSPYCVWFKYVWVELIIKSDLFSLQITILVFILLMELNSWNSLCFPIFLNFYASRVLHSW